MRTERYGSYRGCEICRDSRGWFFTMPVRTAKLGEPVAVRSKRVYITGMRRLIDEIADAIDRYLEAVR